jgi:hypothetical protein
MVGIKVRIENRHESTCGRRLRLTPKGVMLLAKADVLPKTRGNEIFLGGYWYQIGSFERKDITI